AGANIDRGTTHIVTAYQYNDASIRVRATETTTLSGGTPTVNDRSLLVDDNNPTGYAQVLEEHSAGGLLTASYVHGLEPLSQSQAGTASYYLLEGHSGVRLLLNAVNAVLATYRYEAFGGLLASSGTAANPLRYRGERFDLVLGQYYLRARFYDPMEGRFSRPDPLLGSISDPLTLHKYLYGANDPIGLVDPSGMEFTLGGLGKSMVIGGLLNGLIGGAVSYARERSLEKAAWAFGYDFAIGAALTGALYGVGWAWSAYRSARAALAARAAGTILIRLPGWVSNLSLKVTKP